MRVIATRPEENNAIWVKRLEEAGFNVESISLLTIRALGEEHHQAIKNRILNLDAYSKAIFVSQNAVSHALEWIRTYWPQLPVGIHWYGIGAATQTRLSEDLGINDGIISSPSMDSEGLLSRPEMHHIAEQKILIFRGLGGRNRLANTFRARGAYVDYCELYERAFPSSCVDVLYELKLDENDIVPVFSAESLANFKRAANEINLLNWEKIRIVVPGDRVANIANGMGFKHVGVAENASEKSMLAKVKIVSNA